jgi:hypothetical protein
MSSDFILEDPNILLPEGNISVEDKSNVFPVQLRCPHCMVLGIMIPVSSGFKYTKSATNGQRLGNRLLSAKIMRCPNSKCGAVTFVVSEGEVVFGCFPPERLAFDASNIPQALLGTLIEAIACHTAGAFRASAMMVRRLLEEICHDAGANGKDLHSRILGLRDSIVLPQALFDAMLELKAIGNDAAHIEARAYTTIDEEEGRISIELALDILRARFQHEDLAARLKSRRGSKVT